MANVALKKSCDYCGKAATTVDHVVPRCLFPVKNPGTLVTVPACKKCNADKATDDDYLRDMMVIDIDNSRHPVAQELLRGKVARSARSNRSHLARDIRSYSKLIPRHSKGGLYLGHLLGTPLQSDRVNRIIKWITRGLYFKINGVVLREDYVCDVRRVDVFRVDLAIKNMNDLGDTLWRTIGDNVFACLHVRNSEDHSSTLWLQRYYDVFIIVSTHSPAEAAILDEMEVIAKAASDTDGKTSTKEKSNSSC